MRVAWGLDGKALSPDYESELLRRAGRITCPAMLVP